MAYPPAPWRLRGDVLLVPALRGGVMLARYDERATLAYHELIVFDRLTPRGFIVREIYVDSEASRQGGREIWGLPKELAEFDWRDRSVTVRRDGGPLLRASWRNRDVYVRLPLLAPTVNAWGRGTFRAAPALATLNDGRSRPAIAGRDLDLSFPAPTSARAAAAACARWRPATPRPAARRR